MSREILTRADGTPIERPAPEDFGSAVEYMRAFHAYRDEVAKVANGAFDTQLKLSLRGPKSGESFEAWMERTGPQEDDTIKPDDFGTAHPATMASLPWQARRELRRTRDLVESTETPLEWVWRQESRRVKAARKRETRRKVAFQSRERRKS